MPEPETRDQFKAWCLRKLGAPVIEINISEDQCDDRVSEAIRWWWDFHYDGTMKVYYKYLPTPTDVVNHYIVLPENIIGAINIFSVSDPSIRADDLFNIRYQIALNDLYTLTSVSMIPYYMVFQHLALVVEFLVGKQPIRYNRINNIFYVDMDWNAIGTSTYLLIEAYQVNDPNYNPKAWHDRFLQRYTCALLKEQWGSNLKKYGGMQLPGGIILNGQAIFDEGKEERIALEKELVDTYSLPVSDMIG